MIALLIFSLKLLVLPSKPKPQLKAEIAALRQQVAILQCKVRGRVRLTNSDRLFFVLLYRWLPSILKTMTIIQPETVVRWHRAGFRRYWRWKSNSLPPISAELRGLIRCMSLENPLWGAPHIHDELPKLGIAVAQSTVARYMAKKGDGAPSGQSWSTFLRNHMPHIPRKSLKSFAKRFHVAPEPVLRRVDFDKFAAMLKEARGTVETNVAMADGRIIVLKSEGEASPVRVSAAPAPELEIIDSHEALQKLLGPAHAKPSDAYTSARKAMTRMTIGRVVTGGKMGLKDLPDDHYEGAMPGVIEEAILALAAGHALLTLGAFGGAARNMAIALKLLAPSMRVPRGAQDPSYHSAIEEIGGLVGRIPDSVRGKLSDIGREDRAVPLGFAIVRILEKWQGVA